MQIIKTLRYHSLLQKVAPRVTYQDWTYCNTLTVNSLLVLGGRFVRVAEIFGLIQLSAGFISFKLNHIDLALISTVNSDINIILKSLLN